MVSLCTNQLEVSCCGWFASLVVISHTLSLYSLHNWQLNLQGIIIIRKFSLFKQKSY